MPNVIEENKHDSEEQGGIGAGISKTGERSDMNDLFNNLENNIDRYQIDTKKDGSIMVKIGTTYQKGGNMKKSIMRGGDEEEQKLTVDEEVASVFGQNYNFEITLDKSKRTGLAGIPQNVENWLLASFSKEEIMADPEKVLQCLIEADIMKR